MAHIEAMHTLFSAGLAGALRDTPEPAPFVAGSLADAHECGPAARRPGQELFNSSLVCLPQVRGV